MSSSLLGLALLQLTDTVYTLDTFFLLFDLEPILVSILVAFLNEGSLRLHGVCCIKNGRCNMFSQSQGTFMIHIVTRLEFFTVHLEAKRLVTA